MNEVLIQTTLLDEGVIFIRWSEVQCARPGEEDDGSPRTHFLLKSGKELTTRLNWGLFMEWLRANRNIRHCVG